MPKLPHCAGCPLYGAPGPVWGEGDRGSAKLIYIGQNPGRQEISAQRPFVGPSGNVLSRQLAELGIRRSELYLTNQVKCLTPDNRVPSDEEVKHCRPILESELKHCKADTVVLSGALAFKANVGLRTSLPGVVWQPSDNIINRRGCVEQFKGRKWIGTIHPAFIMRMPEFRALGPDDLGKAYRLSGQSLPPIKINTHPTDPEIKDYVHYILTETKKFSYDVETHSILGEDEDDYTGDGSMFDINGISADGWSALVCTREQTKLLTPVFKARELMRYEHNGPFDHFHVSQVIPEPHFPKRFDTMLGAHYLRSYAPKKLKPYVLSVYTDLPYYDRKLESFSRRFYNGMDVLATWQAGDRMIPLMEKWKILDLYYEYGMQILPLLEDIRYTGLNIDVRRAIMMRKFFEQRIAKANQLIAKICGPLFNPNSPKQVNDLLYEKWQLPKQFNTKQKDGQRFESLTSDFDARQALKRWIEKHHSKVEGDERIISPQFKVPYYFLTLQDYLSGEDQKLTFLSRINPDTFRMHPYYKAHGTESFRLSSKPNVQNIPIYDVNDWGGAKARQSSKADLLGGERVELGSLRSIVIPDHPSDWILSMDFEQIQIWLYAFQFKVKWLMDLFESRDYLYGIVYDKLYAPDTFFDPALCKPGQPRTKKQKSKLVPEQRIRRAKAVPLGFLFGRSGEAVADEYDWPHSEGNKLRKWWYDLNPELPVSYDKINYLLQQKGWIRHLFGNVMHFPTGKLTEAINSHAQSPEAFVMQGTMIKVDQELRRRGLREKGNRIMLTVHDSLSLNVTDEHAEEVAEDILIPIATRAIPELDGLRLRISLEVSKMWDWKVQEYDDWKRAREASRASSTTA